MAAHLRKYTGKEYGFTAKDNIQPEVSKTVYLN